jgi:hypothetical protein
MAATKLQQRAQWATDRSTAPASAGAFLYVGLAGDSILYLRRFIGITRPRGICKGATMEPQPEAFRVGEQITLILPYMGLGVGSVGTITRIYHLHPPCYRVRFEHINVTVLVPTEYLARVRMYGRT